MPQELENWSEIHQDFNNSLHGKTYQAWWEETGLTYQDAREWLETELSVTDYKFIDWLKHRKKILSLDFSNYDDSKKEELKNEFNKHIFESWFCDNCGVSGITVENTYFISQKKNFSLCSEKCYQGWEAEKEKWNVLHPEFFKESEYNWICRWKRLGITYSEAQEWINLGFKPADYESILAKIQQKWARIHPDFGKKEYNS